MDAEAAHPLPHDRGRQLEQALRDERLRLYHAGASSSVAGQAVVAVLVVTVMWNVVAPGRLFGWVGFLSLVVGLRLASWWSRRQAGAETGDTGPALRRVRMLVALQGVAWGAAGALLFPAADIEHQVALAFVLTGMAAGSLTLTAFDLRTALTFTVLTLAPLEWRLLTTQGTAPGAMATMVLLFVVFLAVTGLRAQRNMLDTIVLRCTEAMRAQTLERSQRRLEQLSEQVQRKSEALEVTLASMDQGILSLGSDGRVQFYNQRLSSLLDLPEPFLATHPTLDDIARYQQAHGHYGTDLSLFDGEARDTLARWLDGERRRFPPSYHRRTPAGTMLEIKTRYLPEGGMVRTFSDVTAYFEAQKDLQDSQAQSRKLALVAAHTEDAVAITDAEGRIEWINEGFTRSTGFTPAEVAGRRPAEVLRGPDTDAAEAARMDEQLRCERRTVGELVHHARDGRAGWHAVEQQAILGEGGQVQQYIWIARDVSARRLADVALRAARDEAERASRAKSDFLSAMSHELRTPMNAILGFAQLLEADPAHRLPERQRAHVQQILRAGSHLLELINDVLDLARVEAGKQPISVEPIRVSALLDECLTLMRPVAQERAILLEGCTLDDGCDRLVAADRTRLKQVLLNLLSNAIKYNRSGGLVRTLCNADGDAVRISVADTGEGLGPEQRERLFGAFERLGAEHGPVAGAGIGLALSKRMVELMHGHIGIDSEPGRGSTFWIRLPSAAPQVGLLAGTAPALGVAASTPPPSPDAAGRRTVLYIEDNPVNVVLMEAMLEHEPGVRLVTAQLPELGLDLARTERPHLILLDIQLPGIDGYEVLRRLRAAPATRATPVIAISANAMRGDIEQGLRAGFDSYLTKPLDMARLLSEVRCALGR